ncbi:ATP-binding protein [Actinocorallia sp. API 0066]|uniref:AAA family ATPase n=1 Tax=Actinocorallia sp. API 0066 TaxID=2896846 RepID=UPI001E55B315|nr:ATP-binding protein [Actinocorallia sp. API 0066]MCD0448290.1 ATP-binding protein [Actinocorallia sp. API 0066]
MITHIKINGFKSFLDFELDVPPFLALIGPNASGKSNLFDALTLVADVLEHGPAGALTRQERGSALDMFHRFDDGTTVDRATITVTALVGSLLSGGRYRIVVPMVCQIVLEKSDGQDPRFAEGFLRVVPSDELTELPGRGNLDVRHFSFVHSYSDGRVLWTRDPKREVPVPPISLLSEGSQPDRSILALMFRDECQSWRPHVLNPGLMRLPAPAPDRSPLASDGRNLAAVLFRLDDIGELWRLEADLIALIPGLKAVKPLLDKRRQEYDFDAVFAGTGAVLPRALSDGTLRALALLAAAHDTVHQGVLAVEEIENGFHPGRVAELVRRLTRDLPGADGSGEPDSLRQVLVTSHSPALVSALWERNPESLRFSEMVTRIDGSRKRSSRVTRVLPVRTDAATGTAATPWDVERFLGTVRAGDL